MDYVHQYWLFAAKFLTVIVLLTAPVMIVALLRNRRSSNNDEPSIAVKRMNDNRRQLRRTVEAALLDGKARKAYVKSLRKADKERHEDKTTDVRGRLFLCRFTGDLRASAVASLREEITSILSVARNGDEVAVVLESSGGTIHGYGLAASQLRRLRSGGLSLTVLIDKVAASGGYLMACVADTIIAAPFAIVGSIGVVAQLPNFNRLLRRHDVDFELITAGKYKRTLTMFGENTDAGREKFQEEIDEAHVLFKDFIRVNRPQLDLERVATGEYWFGTRALELGLVDRLATSDEYLEQRLQVVEVFLVTAVLPKRWGRKLFARAAAYFGLAPF